MKEYAEALFRNMPDTVFITDAYGYVLDFNHTGQFERIAKGIKLRSLIPDCFENSDGVLRYGGKVFSRRTSPIMHDGGICGYTVLLSDITAENEIIEERKKASLALDTLIDDLKKANGELESYATQVKELADYAEQLRIAQVIHDDAGHALTELHTICEMCLKLKDGDPKRCNELIGEGLSICRRAMRAKEEREYGSLEELLKDFAHMSRIKVEWSVKGKEPAWLKARYPLILRICREAYHNTLDHSLADTMTVSADASDGEVSLSISDNGFFRGEFEKGFGLKTMEENVISSGGNIDFIAQNGKSFEIRLNWRK